MELSILIPTKDRNTILYKSLDHLLEATKNIDCEILIIDNSTGPDISLPSNILSPRIQLFKNPGNKNSVFSSRNFGASIAKSAVLLFIDDDILVTRESMEFVLEFHKSHTHSALNVSWKYPNDLATEMKRSIFGRFLIRSGVTSMEELYGKDRWQTNTLFESNEVASYFFSIRKENFDKIGGYDERHLHEGTDVDIVNRLRLGGIKMYIQSALTIFHNEADRIEIKNWMQRKRRFGEICFYATTIEDSKEHALHYSAFRRSVFLLVYRIKGILFFFIKHAPQKMTFLDFFHFKLLNLLTGAHICSGYYKNKG